MELGLTIPLQRRLKIKKLSYGVLRDRTYCWDLHVITLHGRSCLLAVNAATRYTFTLFDLTIADWNDLEKIFLSGIYKSFGGAGFPEAKGYLDRAGDWMLTKTHGRREVAFLNQAWDDVLALDYAVDLSDQCQPFLDAAVNALPCRCAGYEGLGRSDERLKLLLDSL